MKTFSFSQIHDYFRWLTMRIVKVKYIHRSQRKNFVVCLNRKAFRRLSFSKNFDLTILFYLLAYLDEQSFSKQKIWSSVNYSRKIQSERFCCAENVKTISSSSLLIKKIALKTSSSQIDWDFVLKIKSSRIDNDFVSFYSLIW